MTRPDEPAADELDTDDEWEPFDPWLDDHETDGHGGNGRGVDGRNGLFGGLDDDPRVRAGIEHLQRAAHEVIAASRALLDVAEEMVDSPQGVAKVFGVLGELGDLAQRVGRAPRHTTDSGDGPEPDPPVQRIPVS